MAPAALISAALGFGLQRFIQDIGAGFFITGERQYGFGDVVRISVSGVNVKVVMSAGSCPTRVRFIDISGMRAIANGALATGDGRAERRAVGHVFPCVSSGRGRCRRR